MKKELLKRKEEIEKQLQEVGKKSFRGENGYEPKFPTYGQAEEENIDEVSAFTDNVSLEANLEANLAEIERALNKIQKGKYGICESCGKAIDEKRLQAFPTARFCRKCRENKSL